MQIYTCNHAFSYKHKPGQEDFGENLCYLLGVFRPGTPAWSVSKREILKVFIFPSLAFDGQLDPYASQSRKLFSTRSDGSDGPALNLNLFTSEGFTCLILRPLDPERPNLQNVGFYLCYCCVFLFFLLVALFHVCFNLTFHVFCQMLRSNPSSRSQVKISYLTRWGKDDSGLFLIIWLHPHTEDLVVIFCLVPIYDQIV